MDGALKTILGAPTCCLGDDVAVSNSELRIMLTLQARGQEVAAQVAQQVQKMQASLDSLGQSRGAQAAAQQVQMLGRAAQAAAQQVGQIPAQMAKAAASGTGLSQMARAATQSYQQMATAAQNAARAAQQAASQAQAAGSANFLSPRQANTQAIQAAVNSAFGSIQTAFKNAQAQAQSSAQAISASMMSISNAAKGVAGGVAGGLNGAMNGLKTLVGGLTGIAAQITGVGRSTESLKTASANVNTFSASLKNMLAVGASIVGIQNLVQMLTDGFRAFGSAAIGFNADLELARTTFTSLLGSADKARAFVFQLQDTAARTSFDFPGLLKMAQGLVGVGVQAEMVIPLLKDVAGAMTAAGRSSADVVAVGRAFQQIVTTGKVQADEMNQLAERGIFGWRILGAAIQQTGESIEEASTRARKFGEAGQISANDFLNAFQRAAKSGDWRQIAENATQTFTGALSNVGDGLRNFISSAMEPLFNTLSGGMQLLAGALTSAPVQAFGDNIKATLLEIMAPLLALEAAIKQTFDPSALGLENFTNAVALLPRAMQDAINGSIANGASPMQAVLDAIMAQLQAFTGDMQSAGAQLIASYAQGMMQGASDAIQGAVEFVADIIASFLIGNSPPPAGPLAAIETGGANVMAAYVQGMRTGVTEITGVAQQVVDAFGGIGRSISEADAREAFAGARGNLGALKTEATEVEGVLRGLATGIRTLNEQQAGVQFDIAGIKDAYGSQITDLQRSVDLIKEQNTYAEKQADLIQQQNDAISRQADLRDRIALNELKASDIRAQGDPVQRAALQAQLRQSQEAEKALQLRQRAHDLDQAQTALDKQKADSKAKGGATDQKDISLRQDKINFDREQLRIEQQIYALTDHAQLAQNEARRDEIQAAAALRKADEDRARAQTESIKNAAEIERAQKALAALPLEEQIQSLQRQQETLLDPLERQLNVLQQQERVLQLQQTRWQSIKQNITDAVQAQSAAEKAAKGKGAGGVTAFGAQAGFGAAFNGDKQEIDTSIIGQRAGTSLLAGMQQSLEANAPKIIGGALGAVLGGLAFGPLGFALGGLFGAQVGEGVKARVPNIATIFADAGRTFLQAFAGEWDGAGDEWISPLVRAAGILGIAFRFAADTIAKAWEALKGPVAAAATFVKENLGLVAAALTGLLVPAFGLLLSTAEAVIAPLIALLAPLTPAILAVSAAAVALKLAWDTNFGGIQETVGAAIPGIIQGIMQLKTALDQLMSGDYSGALKTVLSAFSTIGTAIAPILQGIGKAILDAVTPWAVALWEWVKDATPKAIAALGAFANDIYQWAIAHAEPFLKQMLAWGAALAEWVAPMIGPAVQALGAFALAVIQWVAQQIPLLTQALMKWSIIFIGWVVTDVIPQIPGALALLGQAILAGLLALLPVLLQFGTDMSMAIWNGLIEGLQVVAPGLAEWLVGVRASLEAAWAALVEGVTVAVTAIVAAWTALPEMLQAIWDGITAALQTAWDAIMAAWEAFWGLMEAAWEAPGNAIEAGLTALWNSLSLETQQSLTRMVAAATTLWQALQTLIATVLAAIMTVVNAWIATQTTAWNTFITTLTALWNSLVEIATTAWTALTAAITAVVTAWWATMQTQWNAIILFITTIWEKLAATIGPLVQAALDVITTTFSTWWEQQKATAAKWAELGTTLVTALMDAIKLGIDSKIKDISGALTGMMETLTGIIDKVLGRSSSQMEGISDDLQSAGQLDPTKVGKSKVNINPAAGRTEVLKQWAPVLQAIESNGGPLARNIASIILAENGAGNSDLVRNSRNWFSISAVASRRGRGLQSGVDAGGRFASYDSDAQSLMDFLDLIQNSPGYAQAWQNRRGTTGQFINGLVQGNYIVPEPGFPVDTWLQNTARGATEYDQATSGMTFGSPNRMGSSRGPGSPSAMSSFKLTQGQWARNMSDAETICGPRLAALFAESVGRPPTPEEAKNLGMQMGVYSPGAGITAADNFDEYATALIRQTTPGFTGSVQQIGVGGSVSQASLVASQRLMAGAPLVGFNTPNHYFGATQYDPASQRFNTGGTGMVYGNTNPWLTAGEIAKLGGGITNVIALVGQMGDAFNQAGAASTEAVAGVEQPVADTTVATQSLAQSLLGDVVPAGTATGTAIQQMSMSINPLLGQIATGSLTTEELTGKLLEMGQSFGLTNVPVQEFQQGQITADQAMQALIASAALVDPAFAAIQAQMTATDASAQTMAVTFAEGVGNATGQTTAAIQQMGAAMPPLIEQFSTGQITTDQMSTAIVEMAAATGETTRPFRMLQDGATTANQALAQVIADAAKVSPEFAALSDEVNTSGEVTAATAQKFAELVANFRPAAQQADLVATATDETTTSLTDAVPVAATLATTMTDTATQSSTAMQGMQSSVSTSLQTTLSDIQGMAGPAKEAGNAVGKAIMEGIIEGIDSMMGDLEDKLKEIQDKLKEIEEAASKAKEAGKKKGGDGGDDKGDDDKGGEGDSKADRAISAAESMSTQVIAAMRSAADAHSPSQASRELGWDMVAGLEQGQLEDSRYAGMAGDQVVVETLRSMRKAADAHSPSNESKALGQDLVEGLSVGQQDQIKSATDAGGMAIDETLKAMRVAADAHSPSNETYKLGEDVIGGLRKALEDANTGKLAKDLIAKFLKEFDSFGGKVYEQVRTQILSVQQLVAVQEQALLPLQHKIEDQQNAITAAHEGTYRSQLQQNALKGEQLNAEGVLLAIGRDRRKNDIELRDTLAQQEAIRKGSLETQLAEAAAQKEVAQLTAEITKREAGLTAAKIQNRNLQQAITAYDHDTNIQKRQQRDLQLVIDDIMRGTLEQQQAALAAETNVAKGKLRTLQIEDDLANASERGLSQDQVNALFDERTGISKASDNADRQAQMQKLQAQITAAPLESQKLTVEQDIRNREGNILPAKDLAEDQAFNISQVERFQIQPLQDMLDERKANLEVSQQQRDAEAAGLNEGITLLQNTAAIYDAMEQSQQDRIDLIQQAQAFEENYRDTVANGLEVELLGLNQKYKTQSAYLNNLNRELQVLQAGQKVREADLAILEDSRKLLEDMGFSFEPPKPPEAAPPPASTQPKDDPDEGTGRGGKKKEKKKDKKKKKSSSDEAFDFGPALTGVDDGASPFLDIIAAANKAVPAIGRVNTAIGKQTTNSANEAAGSVGDVNSELIDVGRSDPVVTIDDSYVNATYSNVGSFLELLGSTFDPTYGLTVDKTQLDGTFVATGDTNSRLDSLTGLRTLTIGRTSLDESLTSATNTETKLNSLITGRSIMLNDQLVDDAVTSTGNTLTNLTALKDGPAGTGTWNAVFGVNTTHAFNVGSIATTGATTLTGATLEDVEDIDTSGTINSAGFNMNAGAFFANSITASNGMTVNGNGISTTKNIEADDDIKADRIVTGSGRASGGSVNANQMYMVGELGRELFIPDEDGYIINNATTEKLLKILEARTEGVMQEQVVGARMANPAPIDLDYDTFTDPNFVGQGTGPTTVIHKTNEYNLHIHTTAQTEPIIQDFATLQALNGDR